MTDTREHQPGDVALEGLKKRKPPALQSEHHIALVQFDPIGRRYRINVLRIQSQCLERRKDFARRWVRGCACRDTQKKQGEQDGANAHALSVDTFAMQRQLGAQDRNVPGLK